MKHVPITSILFDLGGVLVDWDGIVPLRKLTRQRLDSEQARRFWLESSWVREFETGRCSSEAFASGVVRELALEISPERFLCEFKSWDRGPFPHAVELLEQLRRHYSLYCLSNNNPLHWQKPELQRLIGYFKESFVSFEMGLMKPDRGTFGYVIARLPSPPKQTLFLDDNPECVRAAAEMGFLARQAQGIAGVQKVLVQVSGQED